MGYAWVELGFTPNRAKVGGAHSTMDSGLASHPAAPGSIPGFPKNFSEF